MPGAKKIQKIFYTFQLPLIVHTHFVMLRCACAVVRSRVQRKSVPVNPNVTDGNFGKSFEKLTRDIEERMPFRPTDAMYDRPVSLAQQASEEAAAKDQYAAENYASAGDSDAAAHAGAPAGGAKKYKGVGRIDAMEFADRNRAPFEKVYNPESLRISSAPKEYHYPVPPTKAQLAKSRRQRQMILVTGVLFLLALYVAVRVGSLI